MPVNDCLGFAHGQEWCWKDKHAVHYLCKLHCKRYTQTGSDKSVLICIIFLLVCVEHCKLTYYILTKPVVCDKTNTQ